MAPMCLRKPSLLLLITFNILFFTLVTSTCTCPPKVTPPKPPTTPPKVTPPKPPTSPPKVTPTPKPPTSPPKVTPPKPPTTPPKVTPTPKPPTSPPKVIPSPKPPTSPPKATCPVDVLKLGVCANLLNDLLHLVVGAPSKTPCCPLLNGLADLDAAVCLCTAIKADILGIHLNVPVSLSLLLNYCGKKVPSGFKCT